MKSLKVWFLYYKIENCSHSSVIGWMGLFGKILLNNLKWAKNWGNFENIRY